MKIEICKWYKNVNSPVLFFIDDFANVWIDSNNNGEIDQGEDWGYAKFHENSSLNFLKNSILKNFISVKTTFFVPVGLRNGMLNNPKIGFYSKLINCDKETKEFFNSINKDEKFEIAYHGTFHNKLTSDEKIIPEWVSYKNINEAIKVINNGKEIYKDVFGFYPRGGKYCGYATNEFSDESIDKTGFMWWCRKWNRGIYNLNKNLNPKELFDITIFGENKLIDIPSTIDGGLFSGNLKSNTKTLKGLVKSILKKKLLNKKLQQIDYLLDNKLIISIQEHIAPSRDDGKRQSPNIFDDRESLIYIFDYLKNKNVWYCTGTELAEYYWIRENIKIEIIDKYCFSIKKCYVKELVSNKVSIKINDEEVKEIMQPDGTKIHKNNNCFNLDIIEGNYTIIKN